MTNTKFRIAEYVGEFDAETFEYNEGMTLDQDGIEPVKIIAEYETEEEALKELEKLESDFSKHPKRTSGSYFNVTEFIIEKLEYDVDGDIEDVEYIETAKVSEMSLKHYYSYIVNNFGDFVDVIKNENNENEIKPIFKAKGQLFTTEDYINIEDVEDIEDEAFDIIEHEYIVKYDK